jgi:Flp pilus assembly pilin Flp
MQFQKTNLKNTQRSQQRGQGMSEYIIIVAMVAVGAIAVFTNFGGVIRNQVAGMANELSGQDGDPSIKAAQTSAKAADTAATRVQNMGDYAGQNK